MFSPLGCNAEIDVVVASRTSGNQSQAWHSIQLCSTNLGVDEGDKHLPFVAMESSLFFAFWYFARCGAFLSRFSPGFK
jgi:hypothetical protein